MKLARVLIPLLLAASCTEPVVKGPSVCVKAETQALDAEAVLMVFTQGKCTRMLLDIKPGNLPEVPIVPADNVSIVAFSSGENLFISETAALKAQEAYYFGSNVPSKGLPCIWAGSARANEDTVAAPELRKITASVSLGVVKPPKELLSASVTLPKCPDSYYPADGSFGTNDPPVKLSVKDGNRMNIFPPEAPWTPTLELSFSEGTSHIDIPSQWNIAPGEDITITADFSSYSETALCKVSFSCGDFSSSQEREVVFDDEDIDPSAQYQVLTRKGELWKSARVHKALCSDAARHGAIWNDWDNSKAIRDTMSFCIFEDSFDAPVEVLVRKAGAFTQAKVRPTPWDIKTEKVGEDAVRFTLPSYEKRKVSVEFDGDRQHNLFLFPARPDKDKPSGAGVRYFGPGEHDAGRIDLYDGQTCYIDYGAVVYGSIYVHGDNCTVAGHGILSGKKLRHWGEQYSNGEIIFNCNPPTITKVLKNLTVKDITIVDGPSWNLVVYNYDGVLIDGVNIIDWELNGDGIDIVCSRNVEIRGCFIRSYDDCITLKVRFNAKPVSDLCDVRVHDNLIWNDYARGIVVGPETGNKDYGTGYAHDILIEDCIILQHKAGTKMDDLRAGFAIGQYASPDRNWGGGTSERVERVRARNILFDNIDKTGRHVEIWQYRDMDGTCTMSDVTLENFTILGGAAVSTPAFYAAANQHSIKGLHIKNFMVDGKKITAPGDDFILSGDIQADFE